MDIHCCYCDQWPLCIRACVRARACMRTDVYMYNSTGTISTCMSLYNVLTQNSIPLEGNHYCCYSEQFPFRMADKIIKFPFKREGLTSHNVSLENNNGQFTVDNKSTTLHPFWPSWKPPIVDPWAMNLLFFQQQCYCHTYYVCLKFVAPTRVSQLTCNIFCIWVPLTERVKVLSHRCDATTRLTEKLEPYIH